MAMNQELSAWLTRNDPVRFARDTLGFEPDANQSRVLSVEARRVALACHRQFGKSTTAAVKAVHHALHTPDSLSLVVAPTLRQGCLLLDTIHRFARQLGLELKPDAYNRPSLKLPNGSRIVAVPSEEDNIRGFSAVSLLLIDEAARVSDAVWSAVLPMVSSVDGAVWLMSTPAGKQGFFADLWFNGDPNWDRIRVTAEDSARIAKPLLDEQRRSLSPHQFAQDWLCEFGDTADQVFRGGPVEAAFKPGIELMDIDKGWRRDPYRPRTVEFGYYVGVDLGKHQDYTAFVVLELHRWENGWVNASNYDRLTDVSVRVRHLERLPLGTPYTAVLSRLTRIVEYLGQKTVVVADATGLGAPFIDFLRQSNLRLRNDSVNRPPREITVEPGRLQQHGYLLPVTIGAAGRAASTAQGGWYVPKIDLIETLERMFDLGRLEISKDLPDAQALKGEILGLRRNGNSFEPHSSLAHDDMLMALALAAWRIGQQRKSLLQPDPDILRRLA